MLNTASTNLISPCLIAPPAHCVVHVRPQTCVPPSPPAPARPRSGPSMFAILRAQRLRRYAQRVYVSRRYGVLPQNDYTSPHNASLPEVAEQSEGEGETDKDASMV